MTHLTWFDDHLLARDLLMVSFLVVFYSAVTKLLFGWSVGVAFVFGTCFAVVWLGLSEALARRHEGSMFRYFGGDPRENPPESLTGDRVGPRDKP